MRRVKLVLMNSEEYQKYITSAIKSYEKEKVLSGNWNQEELIRKAEEEYIRLLPKGEKTESNYLYNIINYDNAIGVLWLARKSEKVGFIYDINIFIRRKAVRNLLGKVILITGASSGIGLATALLVASRGAKVIINFHSNERGAMEAVQLIREKGGDAIAIQADVMKKEEVNSMVEQALASFGTIDVLVNNAGGGIRQSSFMDMSEELWEETFRLNVNSVLLCSQAVLKHMIPKRNGKIINVSSAAARIGGAGESIHYASTKGAVNTMTIGMSRELIEFGIVVNGVAPGMVETPFHEKFAPNDNRLERMASSVPIKRAATPMEIAEVIAFLSSDASNYILGEIINVSGGR